MSTSPEEKIYNSIHNIYSKIQYYDKHGLELIIALIIIYFFLVITTYYYTISHLPNVKKDWPKNKCNPVYMPLAGYVITDSTRSKLDIVEDNFNECTQNILTSIANNAFAPLYYIIQILNTTFQNIANSTNSIRAMFNKVRNSISDTATNISSRTLNVTMPLVKQTIFARDSLSRAHGILTTSVNQVFGLFITTFSLFLFMKNVIIGLLIIMAASILALWALSFIPFIGIPSGIAAGIATIGYIAILIPFLIVIILISTIFGHQGGRSPPPIPGR